MAIRWFSCLVLGGSLAVLAALGTSIAHGYNCPLAPPCVGYCPPPTPTCIIETSSNYCVCK